MNWLDRRWYTCTRDTIQQQRWTSYWCAQLGWILRELCWVEKKPIWKGCILYDFIYITFSKWQNYRNGNEISGCQESWWRGDGREECGCKRTTWELLVAVETFHIWTVSALTPWPWHCAVALQGIIPGGNWIKGTQDLGIISCNCIWFHNYKFEFVVTTNKTESLI